MNIANTSNPTPLPKIASSVFSDRVSLVCGIDGVCVGDGAVFVIEIVTV